MTFAALAPPLFILSRFKLLPAKGFRYFPGQAHYVWFIKSNKHSVPRLWRQRWDDGKKCHNYNIHYWVIPRLYYPEQTMGQRVMGHGSCGWWVT